MEPSKGVLHLIAALARLEVLTDEGDPKDLFEVQGIFNNICMTATKKIKEYERLIAYEISLNVYREVGSAKKPVRIAEHFEGYRVSGRWIYRNCDSRKGGFCRLWTIERNMGNNLAFDLFYLKSVSDEEGKVIREKWRTQQLI